MSLPRYSSYTDSRVEWLGQVPTHWSISPLKYLADFVNGDAFKPNDWVESGTPIIRIQNLNGGEEFNYIDSEVEARYLVREGDLLFGWSGNRGTSFGPFIWHRSGVFALNQHIFKVLPRGIDRRALFWTLKAVTAHVEQQAHGIIGMVHITKGNLGSISVPVPPPDEHERISRFLDREAAKIDALIAEQERLLALLDEKRQAVITQAVTKGLDPTVPMKESGVEWVGEVPAHWTLPRLDSRFEIVLGKMLDEKKIEGTALRPYLRNVDVQWDRINTDGLPLMDIYATEAERYLLRHGDLLICEGGEVGRAAVWEGADLEVGFQKALHRARPRVQDESSRFLFYQLRDASARGVFAANGNPNTILHLTGQQLRSYRLPCPPPGEQQEIATYLDAQGNSAADLVSAAKKAIDLLSERRAALISAAVTGQIDVRGLVEAEAV